MRIFILFFVLLTATNVTAQQDEQKENLNVFHDLFKWNNPGSFSVHFLANQTEQYYNARSEQIAKLKTKSDWQKRQQTVRKKLDELLGKFPPKGPLAPEVTSVVKKDGYRIEKIIYQPTPGYYETGCLYIPDNLKGKAPAILNVIGHDQISFREQYYQVIITNLLKKGMIVFAIDPLGQGEHVQYYDSALKFSAVGYWMPTVNVFYCLINPPQRRKDIETPDTLDTTKNSVPATLDRTIGISPPASHGTFPLSDYAGS